VIIIYIWMHLKVFVKLQKTPKNPLVWAKKPKKNPKKPTGLGLKKKKPGFFHPVHNPLLPLI
jgi:hypothetical protein